MNYKGKKDQTFVCEYCGSEFEFRGYSYNHKFCNITCYRADKATQKEKLLDARYQEWLRGGEETSRRWIRQFVIRRDGYKCNCCGITEWNGKPISLWCDHIDGNATNNHPDNFQMICPNCDSQQDTFGAKNKGNGRKARGLPQYG
jgi:hypothetical protein